LDRVMGNGGKAPKKGPVSIYVGLGPEKKDMTLHRYERG